MLQQMQSLKGRFGTGCIDVKPADIFRFVLSSLTMLDCPRASLVKHGLTAFI